MKKLILACAMITLLGACDAKPLRTREEATANAVAEATVKAEVATAEIQEDPQRRALIIFTDDMTGCQYLTASIGQGGGVAGLTPRMKANFKFRRPGGSDEFTYEHVGCNIP